MEQLNYDIAIVGGGITGTALACRLGRSAHASSLKIALVEAAGEPQEFLESHFDPRVVALSEQSQSLLSSMGVWSKVAEARVCPYREMVIWDAEGTGRVHFDSREVGREELGHIVENSVLVRVLSEKVRSLPNVDVFQPQTVERLLLNNSAENNLTENTNANSTKLILNGGVEIEAQLVVAADGAQSKMRELADFPVRQWQYGHTAIVTTVKTAKPHEFTAWQRFSQSGPLAFLPLTVTGTDGDCCSIVWSIETEKAKAMMALGEREFCQQLGMALEFQLGEVLSCEERFAIPLTQRHSRSYFRPGVVLVGDAAHTIHPLAGQGVNLGLYDVECLAGEIERANQRAVELTDLSILKRYERKRQGHNLLAMAIMESFKRLFESDNLFVRWARNTGMHFVDKQSLIKKQLTRLASGHH